MKGREREREREGAPQEVRGTASGVPDDLGVPMPLLGSNRAAEVANGSMDPDRACLKHLGSSEAGHQVLDARSPRDRKWQFSPKNIIQI